MVGGGPGLRRPARCSATSAPPSTGTCCSYDAPRPEVTAPGVENAGVPGIRLHRSHSLDARDTTTHQGIPITTVAPHAARHRCQRPDHHLERALAQAEKLQLYDHARHHATCIARANGHRGTKRLTRAVASDPQFTRSELERRMRRLARKHGLPQPHQQSRPRCPGPPRPRGRLLLPDPPPRRRDRWLGDPPDPPGVRGRPRQGRRPHRRRLHRHALHLAPSPRRPRHRRRAHQSGMLPCFRLGACTRLVSSVSSAEMTFGRVSCGTMTSSTYPRSAAA